MVRNYFTAGVSTLFEGDRFYHLEWPAMTVIPGSAGTIKELGLNTTNKEFAEVEAACVNPLDTDVVWFFCKDEVVDFRVSEKRPISFLTAFDGGEPAIPDLDASKIVTRQKIKDHEIFRVLPPAFHSGITTILALGPSATVPSPLTPTTTTPKVTVVYPQTSALPNNVMCMSEGDSVDLELTMTFASPGSYVITFSIDTEKPQTEVGNGGWTLGLTTENATTPRTMLVVKATNDQKEVKVTASIQAKSAKLPWKRANLKVALGAATIHALEVQLFGGDSPDTLSPYLCVFSAQSVVYLSMVSLTKALASEAYNHEWPDLRCALNGAGKSSDLYYTIRGEKMTTSKLRGNVTTAVELPEGFKKFTPVDGRPGSSTVRAAVPLKIEKRPPTPISAATRSKNAWNEALGVSLPESIVAIPRKRDASLDRSLREWLSEKREVLAADGKTRTTVGTLPPCSMKTPPAQTGLVERMKLFVERLTTNGDLPDFLRTFVAVLARDGQYELVYYAMPDFISVGNETYFVRLPLTARGAQKVLERYNKKGCRLLQPTAKMTAQIFAQDGTQRLVYHGLGDDSISTEYMHRHNALIEAHRIRNGHVLGELTSGHRKEIVVSEGIPRDSKGTVWWGGVYSWSTPDKPTVAENNALAHTKSSDAQDHDEYAQAQRLVHRDAWLRDTSAPKSPWTKVDLESILKDGSKFKILTDTVFTKAVRYPGDLDEVDKIWTPGNLQKNHR